MQHVNIAAFLGPKFRTSVIGSVRPMVTYALELIRRIQPGGDFWGYADAKTGAGKERL